MSNDYDHNQVIDENKRLFKEKYKQAKMLGETVNQTRSRISESKYNTWRTALGNHPWLPIIKET